MATITQQQIDAINSKCSNSWQLDVKYYFYHNEKTLVKQIRLDKNNYLEFNLSYNSNNQISLHISKFFHKDNDTVAVSEGLGKRKILDETKATRKSVNNLIAFTEKLTDTELLEINKNTKASTGYGIIQPSADF